MKKKPNVLFLARYSTAHFAHCYSDMNVMIRKKYVEKKPIKNVPLQEARKKDSRRIDKQIT